MTWDFFLQSFERPFFFVMTHTQFANALHVESHSDRETFSLMQRPVLYERHYTAGLDSYVTD